MGGKAPPEPRTPAQGRVVTTYYTFDLGDRHAGLLRRIRDERGFTLSFETVQDAAWVDSPGALRFFAGYGGDQLDVVELTEEQARTLAVELGVSLSAGEPEGVTH